MTEIWSTQLRLERVEAMLELCLIRGGHADSYLSKEQRDQRLGELGKALWPEGDYTRASHEQNPMNHMYDPKRKAPK